MARSKEGVSWNERADIYSCKFSILVAVLWNYALRLALLFYPNLQLNPSQNGPIHYKKSLVFAGWHAQKFSGHALWWPYYSTHPHPGGIITRGPSLACSLPPLYQFPFHCICMPLHCNRKPPPTTLAPSQSSQARSQPASQRARSRAS